MRTSRISRETARVMNNAQARSPSTRAPSLRSSSLAQFIHDSDDSKSPSLAQTTDTASVSSQSASSRKRKREPPATTAVKVETSSTTEIKAEPPTPHATPPRKRRTPANIKRSPSTGALTCTAPPSHWQEMYDLVRTARRANPTAPVDTMGCERLADPAALPRTQRFQTLVSLMLSSQTKDTVTAAAVRRMQRELPGGLTLESVLAVEPAVLNDMIGKVGFHNVKTKHIKRAAEVLRDEWAGDIPDTIEGLVALPGVGPKMGYLTLSAAWGRTEGIGVDVHVHRITNLWGWHRTKTPEETRLALQSWLPQDRWHEINHLLVGHGQMVCLPVGRRCGECVLGPSGLCPSAVGVKRARKVEEAKIEVKVEGNGEDAAETVLTVKQEAIEQTIKREFSPNNFDIEDSILPEASILTKRTRRTQSIT